MRRFNTPDGRRASETSPSLRRVIGSSAGEGGGARERRPHHSQSLVDRRQHPMERELTDYRSTRPTAEEAERLQRIVRRLMEHGVLMSMTGLGCLSTPMGD